MSAETTPSVDSANQSLPSSEPLRGPAAPPAPGAGPLARFTRPSESPESPAPAEPAKAPDQRGAASPPAASAPAAPAGQPPAGYRPRGRGDRPKSRREKEREEDRQVDRELAAERQAREERVRHGVPVPNLRQRSEELEAEVEAALGGVSL